MAENQAQYGADVQYVCFPCNQFGGQEPKPEAEVKTFVQKLLGPDCGGLKMMEKIRVNGEDACPLYKWLKSKGEFDAIKWNFGTYFMFNKSGQYVACLTGTPKQHRERGDIEKLIKGEAIDSKCTTTRNLNLTD